MRYGLLDADELNMEFDIVNWEEIIKEEMMTAKTLIKNYI